MQIQLKQKMSDVRVLKWRVLCNFLLQSEFPDLIDLENADSIPWAERRPLRIAAENDKFDADHYMLV